MKILKLLITSIIISGNAFIALGQLPDLKIDVDLLESSLEIDNNYVASLLPEESPDFLRGLCALLTSAESPSNDPSCNIFTQKIIHQ